MQFFKKRIWLILSLMLIAFLAFMVLAEINSWPVFTNLLTHLPNFLVGILCGYLVFKGKKIANYWLSASSILAVLMIYLENQSQKFIHQELLYLENGILKTTQKGKFLSDGISSDLFMIN